MPEIKVPDLTPMSPVPSDGGKVLNFHEAVDAVMLGSKAHKLDWEDLSFYITVGEDGRFKLHKPDGQDHDWILTKQDVEGEGFILL